MRRALRQHDERTTFRGSRAAAVVLLLVLATACSRGAEPVREVESQGGAAMDPSSLGRCGARIAPDAGRGGPLELSGSFPARLPGGGEDRFSGTVTVTNRGDARFSGLSAGEADVYVTLAGRIVATPFDKEDRGLALDLAPGASRMLPATGRLRQCAEDVAERPLGPGAYEIHAALSLTEGPDGRPFVVAGGPWPLQVT